MSRSAARWLAYCLFGCYVLCVVLTLALVIWGGATASQGFVVLAAGYAIVGLLVATREPANAIGWLLLTAAVSIGLGDLGVAYVVGTEARGELIAGWLATQSVWLYVGTVLLPLLYPSGRLPTPRWRVALWLGIAGLVLSHLGEVLLARSLDLDVAETVPNPIGLDGPVANVSGSVGNLLVVGCFVLSAVSLILRLRRSHGRERLQLKLFVYVVTLAVSALALGMPSVLAGASAPGWLDVLEDVGWFTTLALILFGLPIAIGVAILRHRLYDIDLVIKRTLVYGSLTAFLAATYLGLVLVIRLVLSPLAGNSDLAVAGSTLAVAALFRPLRSRIQRVVNRRFYRSRYDAARTLEGFAVHLRDELDLDTLGAALSRVVRDTMQPAHVSLWLREAER